jgi:hypothetical protein
MNRHTVDYRQKVILNLHFQSFVYFSLRSYTMSLLELELHIFDKLNEP